MIRSVGNDFQAYYGRDQREYEKESSERRGLPEKDDPDQNRADCTDTRPDGIGRPDGQCFQYLRYDRQAQRDRTDRARNPQRLFRSCGFIHLGKTEGEHQFDASG